MLFCKEFFLIDEMFAYGAGSELQVTRETIKQGRPYCL